jgi:tetratricopeptide (TPR) repeat protein
MRSIFTNKSILFSIAQILVLLCSAVFVVSQTGLGSKGTPAKPPPPRPISGTRERRATPRRHNPLPNISDTAEATTPEKLPDAAPLPAPGVEDKAAGIEAYNKDDYDTAITRLSAARAVRPADAEIFYYLGDSYSFKKQYPEAIEAYERARKIDEKLATEGNYFNLGYAYEVTNNNPEALAAYRKALEKKSDNPETLTHLGDVYSKSKDWKNAIDAYERAYAINPNIDDPDVFFNWGIAYVNSSMQYDKAVPKFEKAIALKIDNIAEAYFQLGRAYKSTGRFAEAVEAHKKQLQTKANDENAFWAYSYLGEIYTFDLPNREAARDAYQGAVAINPKDHEAWSSLGTVQNNLGKNQEAADAYYQAVQLDPNNADYRRSLGKSYWRLQRYTEAVATLDKAVELNPKLSEAYYYRGISYRDLFRFDQAVESLSKAIEIGLEKRSVEGNARYALALSYSKVGNAAGTRQQCDVLRGMGSDAPSDSFNICR